MAIMILCNDCAAIHIIYMRLGLAGVGKMHKN